MAGTCSPIPHIFLLPDELLLQIYSYLPFPSLAFLRLAHPRFDHIFTTPDLLPVPNLPRKETLNQQPKLQSTSKIIPRPDPRVVMNMGPLPGLEELFGRGTDHYTCPAWTE
ncbi:MAG: hypothetical protein Q9181_005168 [Wetmoreana brouardii]